MSQTPETTSAVLSTWLSCCDHLQLSLWEYQAAPLLLNNWLLYLPCAQFAAESPRVLRWDLSLRSVWNPDGLLWLHAGFDTLSHIKQLNICCAPAVNCHPDLPSIKWQVRQWAATWVLQLACRTLGILHCHGVSSSAGAAYVRYIRHVCHRCCLAWICNMVLTWDCTVCTSHWTAVMCLPYQIAFDDWLLWSIYGPTKIVAQWMHPKYQLSTSR